MDSTSNICHVLDGFNTLAKGLTNLLQGSTRNSLQGKPPVTFNFIEVHLRAYAFVEESLMHTMLLATLEAGAS